MKQRLCMALVPLALLLLGQAAAHADEPLQQGGKLTCNGPVSNSETGESLYSRYGEDAILNTFQDHNNNSFVEAELFPFGDNPLHVRFVDNDFVKHVASIEVWSGATAWSVEGVKIGMTLEEVAAINGSPFKLGVTDYDLVAYGSFDGGRLERLAGGCRLRITFMIPSDVRIPQSVNRSEVSSDHPELVKARPTVTELSLSWPRK